MAQFLGIQNSFIEKCRIFLRYIVLRNRNRLSRSQYIFERQNLKTQNFIFSKNSLFQNFSFLKGKQNIVEYHLQFAIVVVLLTFTEVPFSVSTIYTIAVSFNTEVPFSFSIQIHRD